MAQINSSPLTEIFTLESMEDWRSVSIKYASLYAKIKTNEIAIHYAFFCWYLLWQWDEICFPGEESLPVYERPNAEIRNGISKTELFSHLDEVTKHLLTTWEYLSQTYFVVLLLMHKIYPYFFKKETFSRELEQQMLDFAEKMSFDDIGARIIYHYIRTKDSTQITPYEKMAVNHIFPQNSLIQSYFTWLFE